VICWPSLRLSINWREMPDDVKQQYGWLAAEFGKRQLPLQGVQKRRRFLSGHA
jgi:hypothetical protein